MENKCCMATYHLLLAVEEILDGRLEFDKANRHGLGLGSISVSEGILDFRADTKHGIESRSQSRVKTGDIERTKRYSSEEREIRVGIAEEREMRIGGFLEPSSSPDLTAG